MLHRIGECLLSLSLPDPRLPGTLTMPEPGRGDQRYRAAPRPAVIGNLLLVSFPPSEEEVYIQRVSEIEFPQFRVASVE